MDEQNSRRWLETINRERRTKDAWKEKYLTKEELQRLREEQDALAREEAEKPVAPSKLSEREGMLKRLAEYEVSPEEEAAAAARPMTTYEAARLRVAQQVDATRPRSHRMTQDLSTPSLLRDVGPGLWISINPGAPHHPRRAIYRVHRAAPVGPAIDPQVLSRIAAASLPQDTCTRTSAYSRRRSMRCTSTTRRRAGRTRSIRPTICTPPRQRCLRTSACSSARSHS